MKYMLDTNMCIYLIKKKPLKATQKFLTKKRDEICISSITYSELEYGINKSMYPDKSRLALTMFLSNIMILEYNDMCGMQYGIIRAELERKGNPIGPMDMLIAAHAKAYDLILVTNNEKEFKRVKDLKVENWA